MLSTGAFVQSHLHTASTPAADADGDFTIIEMQLDQKGIGDAKAAYANVIVDAAAKTLALDGQASSPMLLKVTR